MAKWEINIMTLKTLLLTTLLTTASAFGSDISPANDDSTSASGPFEASLTTVTGQFNRRESSQRSSLLSALPQDILGFITSLAIVSQTSEGVYQAYEPGYLNPRDIRSLALTCQRFFRSSRLALDFQRRLRIGSIDTSVIYRTHLQLPLDPFETALVAHPRNSAMPEGFLSREIGNYIRLPFARKLHVIEYFFIRHPQSARQLLHTLMREDHSDLEVHLNAAEILSKYIRNHIDVSTLFSWLTSASHGNNAIKARTAEFALTLPSQYSQLQIENFNDLGKRIYLELAEHFDNLSLSVQEKTIIGLCKTNCVEAIELAERYFQTYITGLLYEETKSDTLTPVQHILNLLLQLSETSMFGEQTTINQLIIDVLKSLGASPSSDFDSRLGAAELMETISLIDAKDAYEALFREVITEIAKNSNDFTENSIRLSHCPQNDPLTTETLNSNQVATRLLSSKIDKLTTGINNSWQ